MNRPRRLLELRGIVKSYPGVKALQGVDLSLDRGEVLALLGENGAGKSTLMKVLGGACLADQGTIEIDSQRFEFHNPSESQRAGVAVIYQEFNLVPGLTAVENIFLGKESTRLGFIRRSQERHIAMKLFERLGASIDLDTPCRSLTTAQLQLIEIAKALSCNARILVLDEPTAALSSHEVHRLFAVIRELKSQGMGMIYISHRLEEIFQIADRVHIMRDGRQVCDRRIQDIHRKEMIEKMVGRELMDEFPRRQWDVGQVRLRVKNFNRGRFVRDVSFEIKRGEILGMAGLIGAGRTETARLIFGADQRDSGELFLDERPLDIHSPRQAIQHGIGLLPEDRKRQGLVLSHSVRTNFALPNLDRWTRFGWIQSRRECQEFEHYVQALGIRIPHQEQLAVHLSGGNQQKVVLTKWLARHCEVLLFDEPTRGIDAGTKYEIYQLMQELAANGKSILMISSELPELLGMCHRILVMRSGQIRGEIADPGRATQEDVMQLALD